MPEAPFLDFTHLEFASSPFPHFCAAEIMKPDLGHELLAWLASTEVWSLTEAEFYTQYEFSLFDFPPPGELCRMVMPDIIRQIGDLLASSFNAPRLEVTALTAHKLIEGHRIAIHNDYIGSEETHRLVVQVTPAWDPSKGGYLMLFHSDNSRDIAKLVKPILGSAFGFEISEHSYHAVSEVHQSERYSIVYTFRKTGNANP